MGVVVDRCEPDGHGGTAVVRSSILDGGVIVLQAEGEVDLATGPVLVAAIDEALQQRPTVLVIDLGRVSFFGSTAMSALLYASERVATVPLSIVVTPNIRRLFRMTGIEQRFTMYDCLEDAFRTVDGRACGPG